MLTFGQPRKVGGRPSTRRIGEGAYRILAIGRDVIERTASILPTQLYLREGLAEGRASRHRSLRPSEGVGILCIALEDHLISIGAG